MKNQLNEDNMPRFYENSFDYFRLFAAVQVLLGHIVLLYDVQLPKICGVFLNMFEGVPILFTLCGFLVTASFLKSSSVKEYFLKRVLRIFPPLWLSVFVGFIILWIYMGNNFPALCAIVWTILQGFSLQYTPAFAENFGSGTFNGALWALFTELQFYILLPLLLKLMKKRKMRTWVILGGIFFVLSVCGTQIIAELNNEKIYFVWKRFILSQIMFFYIGSFICVFKERILSGLIKCFPCMLLGYILGYILHSYINLGYLYYILAYCLVPFVIIGGGYWLREHRLKIDISYGVYLYHVMVINVFIQLGIEINIIAFSAIVLISILCGLGSTYFEKLIRMCVSKKEKTN